MDWLMDFLEWVCEHPFLALIYSLVIIYLVACGIDLFAPIETSRGSWWNIFAQILRLVCRA